jgi:outer membrane protein OmpA-like peptidoglycan-associated protein
MTRWLPALIAVAILFALGAYFWTTFRPHVAQAPAPAARVAQKAPAAPLAAPSAGTSASAPPPASVAQAPASAPALAPEVSSSAPVPAPAPAPTHTPVVQTSPSAPSPAGRLPAPAQPATSTSQEAGTKVASLEPGFGDKDLITALNDSKFDFPSGGATVPAAVTPFLKRAAKEVKELPPGHVLEIAGYTDSSGNPAKNVVLSQKRAEAIRDALIKEGANPDLLVAKGYGDADPIASNATPEGRARNRRIEYHIIKTP